MYDIIGDIHGYYEPLCELLYELGYYYTGEYFYHPERQVIFVGDFIDRGPYIRETLLLANTMVANNAALAIMGNHEYNALCFHTQDTDGNYLRPHTSKNVYQHTETLNAFAGRPGEWKYFLQWFMRLPLFLDLHNIRVVHASWVTPHIRFLKQNLQGPKMTEQFFRASSVKGTREYVAIDELLKGLEIDLPEGYSMYDKEGNLRQKMRIKWWEDGLTYTYPALSLGRASNIPDERIPDNVLSKLAFYPPDAPPVFFGHYWLRGQPEIQAPNVCCIDYSVAKDGKLVAYQWQGEKQLRNDHFHYIR